MELLALLKLGSKLFTVTVDPHQVLNFCNIVPFDKGFSLRIQPLLDYCHSIAFLQQIHERNPICERYIALLKYSVKNLSWTYSYEESALKPLHKSSLSEPNYLNFLHELLVLHHMEILDLITVLLPWLHYAETCCVTAHWSISHFVLVSFVSGL